MAPGPFSALFPTRFILDDSALYLSDKCEVETLDLRRGGQGLGWAPSTLRDNPLPHSEQPDVTQLLTCTQLHIHACLHTYAHNHTGHNRGG